MEYKCKPLYKYLALTVLIFLFIFHQKTSIAHHKILLVASIVTVFIVILDYAFIDRHPPLFYDMKEKKKTRRKKRKEKKKKDEDEYINELLDMIDDEEEKSSMSSRSSDRGMQNPLTNNGDIVNNYRDVFTNREPINHNTSNIRDSHPHIGNNPNNYGVRDNSYGDNNQYVENFSNMRSNNYS
jgi:hypothetical protein